ncbi:universal stress protein [Noviherbaspirillum galbum]|uniref:Universal stress protein n=1 Tax=Noviherbaspirillum galbum TaxID=2709383 RepID=A0A6B3SQX3_9BURK|nr:universal stress protein [Noviherbaspirillum galbum]NEX61156.1 universal stress protein [Noviherbaspirillum galbum]
MTYKTVLVHVDPSPHASCRMRLAADIAARHGAHLVGAAMTGISRFAYPVAAAGHADPYLVETLAHLDRLARSRAEQALDAFRAIADTFQPLSYEATLFSDEPSGGMSLRARYSDLAVISQFDPDDADRMTLADFPESVMLESGAPVLIVPFAGDITSAGRRPLVAWDGGANASRAVRGALPLLQSAERTDVVVINSDKDPGLHGDQPGDDIALFLARHGVKAEVLREESPIDVANCLLSLAMDRGNDMIVMGGYGHARLKEIMLGGTTRTIFQSMTVPVLMAH